MNVPFFRVDAGGNELDYVREVLESGWLTSGGRVQAFEEAFAACVSAKHAIAVNSCTAALHLGCEAAGVGPGSEVLVPSVTFTATAEIVEYLGGRVRLVDVDPDTAMLTPEILADALDRHPRISAVIPVHFGGRACTMRRPDGDGILDLCDARGIAVIEDAAHAFPSRYDDGAPVGSKIGSVACCFSFYANKTMTTGEGGMVTTDDDDLAERMRRMRLHGIDRNAWDRHHRVGARWEYDVVAAGYKYNLTDLAAAIGLAQLERHDAFHRARIDLADRYRERLGGTDGLRLPARSEAPERDALHLFVVHVDRTAEIDRNGLIEHLNGHGVGTSVHYRPLHTMTHWSSAAILDAKGYDGADRWFEGCVSLPLFPSMTDAEFDHVSDAVAGAFAGDAKPLRA